MRRETGRKLVLTSPRLRGEVGAKRRVRGYRPNLIVSACGKSPSPQPSPRKSGAREQS
jgi:hypothetical protein